MYKEIVNKNLKGLNVLDKFKDKSNDELREININDTFPYISVLLSVTGDLNISNMIRTSSLSGSQKVIIFGRRHYDKRGATGTQNYVILEKYNGFEGNTFNFNTNLFLNILQNENVYPVFIEQNGTPLNEFDWYKTYNNFVYPNKKFAIIVGNEENGIPNSIIDKINNNMKNSIVSIPQRGVSRSFNVGSAYAMVVWDMRLKMGWI